VRSTDETKVQMLEEFQIKKLKTFGDIHAKWVIESNQMAVLATLHIMQSGTSPDQSIMPFWDDFVGTLSPSQAAIVIRAVENKNARWLNKVSQKRDCFFRVPEIQCQVPLLQGTLIGIWGKHLFHHSLLNPTTWGFSIISLFLQKPQPFSTHLQQISCFIP